MSYDSVVAADSPQLYYKMQETSGTTLTDSSGSSRNGTYGGTVNVGYKLNQAGLLATDSASKSVLFSSDGTDLPATPAAGTGYASVAYATYNGINATGLVFSAECWLKVNSSFPARWATSSGQIFMGRRKSTLQWELRGQSAGQGSFSCWEVTYAGGTPGFSSSFVPSESESVVGMTSGGFEFSGATQTEIATLYDGLPHHIVAVRNGGYSRLFIDGIGAPIYYTGGLVAFASDTTQPLTIGSYTDAGNGGFIGYIGNVAFYTSALTAEKIMAHYTAGVGFTSFVNANWQFSGAFGMTLDGAAAMASGFDQLRKIPLILAGAASASAAISIKQRLRVAFMDAASISDAIAISPVLQWMLANSINVNAALGLHTIQQYDLHNTILSGIAIQVGEDTYNGWVINPALRASVAAEGFNFTSFAGFRGKYYAARDDGIYRMGGDTDAGKPILSYISLPQSTFGTAKMKRVPYAYIGAASDGTMVLRVIANGQEFNYAVRNPTTEMAEQRVDIGKGIKSNYWQFELINPDGANFSLDTIKFLPVILERRI